MERLDKILASTGRWSRREVKELVRAGRVTVNGTAARSPEEKYRREGLELLVDGQSVLCERYTYLMLHKPAGLVSATEDPRQATVLDLLPEHLRKIGLFPAGRLDRDTEGLLLTNDGALAHDLLSPRKHVDKTYFVRVEGRLDQSDAEAFQSGMTLGDGLVCLPAGLALLEAPDEALVTLREGKYHQIKRMLAARGKPVRYLKRLAMGPLVLDQTLEKGQWRPLEEEELTQLRSAGGAWTENPQKNYRINDEIGKKTEKFF